MTALSVSEARGHLADLINRVHYRKQRIVIKRKGKKMAVLVPIEDIELLQKMENERDRKRIKKGMKEIGKAIPLAAIRKKYGIS